MNKRFLPVIYILLLFFAPSSFSQNNKIIDIPVTQSTTRGPDTSCWFRSYTTLASQLKLPDMQTSKDNFRFRFWTDKQVIEIWTTDSIHCYGSVTSFAERYNEKLLEKGSYEVDKIFSKTASLDTLIAKYIYQAIITLQILKIPSDENIKDWGKGFDGVEYIIETADAKKYTFKNYWTPYVFADAIPEAKRIQQLVDYLFKELNMYDYYYKLKLRAGHYKSNGISGVSIRADHYNGGPDNILEGL